MAAELSFPKRAAAELTRRLNGLAVRARGCRTRELRTPGPRDASQLLRDPTFLDLVFRHLAWPDRGAAAQVCRTWRDVLYQPRFWTSLAPVLRCRELRGLEPRRRFYASLERRGFDSLILAGAGDEDVADLLAHASPAWLRGIRRLSLRCCNVSDRGLAALVAGTAAVSRLELAGCNELTDTGLWGALPPRLTSLALADCLNVADESVAAVAQRLPHLRELDLQAYHVTDAALALFAQRQSAELVVVRLRSCWEVTNQGVAHLVRALPHLRHLSLAGCSKVTDDGVEVLAENLPRLVSLDLSWCPRISDAALEYIACDLTALEELALDRQLGAIDFRRACALARSMAAELSFPKRAAAELTRRLNGLAVRARGCRTRELRTPGPRDASQLLRDPTFLDLVFRHLAWPDRGAAAQVCRTWRDVLYQPRFWTSLAPVLRCRELRGLEPRRRFYASLERRGFDSLILAGAGDEDVADLLAHASPAWLRGIRRLSLRCCNVSDRGLAALVAGTAAVSRLELAGCNELTDTGLWGALPPRLTSLALADCLNVADESVAAVAQRLPHLRELDLQAYHVTDAALALFAQRQSAELVVVRLRSCWEVTNQGVAHLVRALPHLRHLSLAGCSKVTDDGVEVLAENLPRLVSLDLSWCPRISDAALEYIACDLTALEELALDRLHEGALYARRPMVCIPLTSAHRRARLNWCLEHHAWTHDQWANVLFSDESRFSLNTDFRRVFIWREPGTRYHPSNIREIDSFRGGGLLVWAGISSSRRTPLHIFSGGTLTAQRYRDEILEPYLRPYRYQIGHNLIFMDDNARQHRARLVNEYLQSILNAGDTTVGMGGDDCRMEQSTTVGIDGDDCRMEQGTTVGMGGDDCRMEQGTTVGMGGDDCRVEQDTTVGMGGDDCRVEQDTTVGMGGDDCRMEQDTTVGMGGDDCRVEQGSTVGMGGDECRMEQGTTVGMGGDDCRMEQGTTVGMGGDD
ncbi:FBXL16, partial [Cordylochernes scorpioides]